MTFTAFRRTAIVVLAAIGLTACGINSIPTKEEAAKAKWADVQAAFQERANLIPNLAEVAKGAAEQERGILTDVIEARAKATSIQVNADDVTDPAKMAQYQAAQNQLSSGLGRLLASFEAYPDLKSIANYQMLQSQLEGQENRVRIAIPTARPGALFAWIADLENAGVVVDTIDVTNNGDQTVAANILLMKRGA